MLSWFQQLSPNDRRALIAGTSALFIILFYLLILEPLFRHKADLQQQVAVQNEVLQTMLQQAQEFRQLQAQSGNQTSRSIGNQSLLGIIDSSINQSSLRDTDKRIEPRASDSVRVNFNAVSFDELVRWLSQLNNQYQIRLDSINIERQEASGLVKAYMTLVL